MNYLELHEAAIRMRQEGKSLRSIAHELKVGQKVIYRLVAEVILTKAQEQALRTPGSDGRHIQSEAVNEKRRPHSRRLYQRNKTKLKDKLAQRRRLTSEWFDQYRSQLQCGRCPEPDVCCYEFHHVDGNTKEHGIANMVGQGYSKERILTELAKCVCLCDNCHRKLHYYKRHPDKLAKPLICADNTNNQFGGAKTSCAKYASVSTPMCSTAKQATTHAEDHDGADSSEDWNRPVL